MARSAISFFLMNEWNLVDNVYIKRIFKFFYRVRPLKARYSTFWSVNKLLDFLKMWHPPETLCLKKLTIKTIALLALSSSDRGQTLHLLNLNNMEIGRDSIKFVILDKLKTTRKVIKPKIVTCLSSEIEELCLKSYISAYIKRTSEFRGENDKIKPLFISWATKRPVSKQTIARWLTEALKLSGIDTTKYKSHSYRGSGLSAAQDRGASIQDIIKQGNWTSKSTFLTYYNAPSDESNLGRLILNNSL